jgi:hypothetical protein
MQFDLIKSVIRDTTNFTFDVYIHTYIIYMYKYLCICIYIYYFISLLHISASRQPQALYIKI